jgi:iron-sulfur cluster repair protein YtfE (RIC family)
MLSSYSALFSTAVTPVTASAAGGLRKHDELLAELESDCADKKERDRQWALLSQLTNYIIARYHSHLRKDLPHIENVIAVHGPNHSHSLLPLRRIST